MSVPTVDCAICYDDMPYENRYRRKNCNDRCNDSGFPTHKGCYQKAMSVKSFINLRCPSCNTYNPEEIGGKHFGTKKILKYAAVTVLSTAVYVAGMAGTIYLNDLSKKCAREDRMICSWSAYSAQFLLVVPTALGAVPLGGVAVLGCLALAARCRLFN